MLVPFASAYYIQSDEPELIVEVYLNKYNEDFILNTTLDDGSKVADYDYQIVYVQPLTRSSNMLEDYFNYVAWLVRDDGPTLALEPNESLLNSAQVKDEGWDVLVDSWYGTGGSPYWYNEQGMLDQYNCHFDFAKHREDIWNLEPWRPVVSWETMFDTRCNPT